MPYQPPGYDPDAQEFGHIKPGKHNAIVESLELRYGEESGAAYVAWSFSLIEGEFKNRRLWNNTTLQSQGINMPTGFYKSVIAALGEGGESQVNEIQSTEWDDEETMVEHAASLVCGRFVTIGISNRTYQGKPQNEVIGIKVYEGDLPQLDTEELAAGVGTEHPKAEKGKGKSTKRGAAKSKSGDVDF